MAFLGGFVPLAYGLDWLCIGLTREALYRRHVGDSSASAAGTVPAD